MDPIVKGLIERIDSLERKVDELKVRRIYQQDIVPQTIKNRHMGEANAYVNNALTDLTLDGASVDIGTQVYYKESDSSLNYWNSADGRWETIGGGGYDTATWASAVSFDVSRVKFWALSLDGTPTALSVTGTKVGSAFCLQLTQGAAGSKLVTWFSTIYWDTSSAPVLSTTAGKIDTFVFKCIATGVYLGSTFGQNMG